MDDLEQPEESGRELILNMSLKVNKIQAQGQMEAKRHFFFTFIEKSQEHNFERSKKYVIRPEKSFAGKEAYRRERQGNKGKS